MNKLWTLGFALFVFGGISQVAVVIAWMVALVVAPAWSPGELPELQTHAVCALAGAYVLSVAGFALAKFSEKKGE